MKRGGCSEEMLEAEQRWVLPVLRAGRGGVGHGEGSQGSPEKQNQERCTENDVRRKQFTRQAAGEVPPCAVCELET